MNKIKKELKEYIKFKQNFHFELKEMLENVEGIYVDNKLINDKVNDIKYDLVDDILNVRFNSKVPYSKCLSNLFPYEFKFRGKKVNSIESVFQALKFRDKKIQKEILKYSGLESNFIKVSNDFDWKIEGYLYWMNKKIKRDSKEYELFIDELFVSALQNPLYRGVLKNVFDKYILHTLGVLSKNETVFTREEFEKQLNCLKSFVNLK